MLISPLFMGAFNVFSKLKEAGIWEITYRTTVGLAHSFTSDFLELSRHNGLANCSKV
jgi:hypothetical protein